MPPDLRVEKSEEMRVVNVLKQGRRARRRGSRFVLCSSARLPAHVVETLENNDGW